MFSRHFRPCELQISDFENAAVCCFVVLLTRSILSFKWNLLMPISKVDENMKRAQKRDAVLTEKFWWRKDIFTACEDTSEPELTEMSIDEILNGIPGSEYQVEDRGQCRTVPTNTIVMQGLITLVRDYLKGLDDVEADTMCTLSKYWTLLSQRASGKLKTNAKWMRDFLTSHSSYKQDSLVSEEAVYDLMVAIDQIQKGVRKEPTLFAKAEKTSKSAGVKES